MVVRKLVRRTVYSLIRLSQFQEARVPLPTFALRACGTPRVPVRTVLSQAGTRGEADSATAQHTSFRPGLPAVTYPRTAMAAVGHTPCGWCLDPIETRNRTAWTSRAAQKASCTQRVGIVRSSKPCPQNHTAPCCIALVANVPAYYRPACISTPPHLIPPVGDVPAPELQQRYEAYCCCWRVFAGQSTDGK